MMTRGEHPQMPEACATSATKGTSATISREAGLCAAEALRRHGCANLKGRNVLHTGGDEM